MSSSVDGISSAFIAPYGPVKARKLSRPSKKPSTMPEYITENTKSKSMNKAVSSDSSFPHSQYREETLISAFIYLSIIFRKGLMQSDHFHQRSLVFTGIKVVFTAKPIQDFLCCIQLAFHVRKQLVFLFFGHFFVVFLASRFSSHTNR